MCALPLLHHLQNLQLLTYYKETILEVSNYFFFNPEHMLDNLVTICYLVLTQKYHRRSNNKHVKVTLT